MKEKKQKNIKIRAFLPFVGQFFHSVVVYILTPIFLFIVMLASLMSHQGGGLLFLLLLAVLWYFSFVVNHFKPGVRVLSDTIFNTFEIHEIEYENSFINRYHHFPLIKKQSEGVFLEIYCRMDNNNQRIMLRASRYHGMIPGEKYTVKYGKRSKVLISILSENGEDLWDVPPDEWRAKFGTNFVRKNKSNHRKR